MRNTTERFVHKLSEGDASMRDLLVSKRFGDGNNHLPILVRSGAQISTPDMMNTTLNLGLNEEAVRAPISKTGNLRRDWDSYLRFIPLYGSAVMGVPGKISERKAEQHVRRSTAPEDIEGMHHAERVLTSLGGMVGHTAAAVAKGIRRCCVWGLSDLGLMDEDGCRLSNQNIREGNWIFPNGETRKVYAGKLPARPSYEIGPFTRVMSWANRFVTWRPRPTRIRRKTSDAHRSRAMRESGCAAPGTYSPKENAAEIPRPSNSAAIGLDYVPCSTYQSQATRLGAAQASLGGHALEASKGAIMKNQA